MKKHMTLDERITIQKGLREKKSFAEIAVLTGRSRSTISREVKARRTMEPQGEGNVCKHRRDCSMDRIRDACRRESLCGRNLCRYKCGGCNPSCGDFEPGVCTIPGKAPYVCNGCTARCTLAKWKYDAGRAHAIYRTRLKESREGISLTESQLMEMDGIVSPLLRRGQSIAVVYGSHADELPVSERTLYAYVDAGLLDAKNLDLRLKVRRRVRRKKSGPTLKVDKKCHEGRSYGEFLQYMQQHPDEPVSQLDTVEGDKGGSVLMTLMLTNCGLQLMFLLERKLAASVSEAFAALCGRLGAETFGRMFPVILTDRGSEFTDPERIERDRDTGALQSRVFYCDPQRSDQKGGCEKNHAHIRYVLPKGKSMNALTQADIDLLSNHINSYPRGKWNGKSPIEVFIGIYGRPAADALGLRQIEPDSINLTPSLLK